MKLYFSYLEDHTCRLLNPKIIIKIKISQHNFQNPTLKMETLVANAYTHLDKSKLLEINSIAIATNKLLQRKIYVKKCHFFTKWYFEEFINRMNQGYKTIWKLQKFYCFEDFTQLLAFFCVSKNMNQRKQGD